MHDPDFDPYLPPRAPIGLDKPKDHAGEPPWLTIWTQPRRTIRGIVEADPNYLVLPLAALSGIANSLGQSTRQGSPSPLVTIGLAIVFGSIAGIIGNHVMGFFVTLTAHWLGGTASRQETRAALAWSFVPGLAILPMSLLILLWNASGLHWPGLTVQASFVGMLLTIWVLVVGAKCVGEVNLFSAWRGFFAWILGGLMLVATVSLPFVAFVLLIHGLNNG